MKNRLLVSMGAAVIFVIIAVFVPAAGAAGWFSSNGAGYIKLGDTVDSSVYMAGNTQRIEGTVNGDVYCAGQDVVISGTVNGDVICAGMNIVVNGKVTSNIRAAGSAVTIGAEVGGSITIFGSTVTVESAAVVGRDAVISAETVLMNGGIGRDFVGNGTDVTLNGPIGRDVDGTYSMLTIGKDAVINGTVRYTSYNDAVINGKVAGEVKRFDSGKHQGSQAGTSMFMGALIIPGWVIVTALALLLVLPKKMRTATNITWLQALIATVIGLFAIIGLPFVAALLLMSVIAIPLGIALLLAWAALGIVSVGVTAIYLGRMLFARRNLHPAAATMLGGLVVVALLVIPYINIAVFILSIAFGVGAMVYAARGEYEGRAPKKPKIKLAKG